MGIHINPGYRFPQKRLRDFQDLARGHAFRVMRDDIIRRMKQISSQAVHEYLSELGRKIPDGLTDTQRQELAQLALVERLIRMDPNQASQFNCGWNLWPHAGFFYAVPWGLPFYAELSAYMEDWLEEYSYWDLAFSSTPPHGLSSDEWEARRRTWRNVCLDNYEAYRLSYTIMDIGRGFHFDELLSAVRNAIITGTLRTSYCNSFVAKHLERRMQ